MVFISKVIGLGAGTALCIIGKGKQMIFSDYSHRRHFVSHCVAVFGYERYQTGFIIDEYILTFRHKGLYFS